MSAKHFQPNINHYMIFFVIGFIPVLLLLTFMIESEIESWSPFMPSNLNHKESAELQLDREYTEYTTGKEFNLTWDKNDTRLKYRCLDELTKLWVICKVQPITEIPIIDQSNLGSKGLVWSEN